MIQRIQTVYLLLVALLSGLTLAFDIALYRLGDEIVYHYSILKIVAVDGSEIVPGNWALQLGLIMLIIAISIFTISRYKHRKTQLKLGAVNYLLLAILIINSYFSVENTLPFILENGKELSPIYYIGFYLPIAAVSFQFLANRGIKKDEELVKSVERLR